MGGRANMSDVRTIACMLAMGLVIAGAVMGAIDIGNKNGTYGDWMIFAMFASLLCPLFCFIGFVWNVPQLFTFSLAFLWATWSPQAIGWQGYPGLADDARVHDLKLRLAAYILIMIGQLLGLAPIIKHLKLHKPTMVAFLLCSAFWITAICIIAIKYKSYPIPVEASIALLVFGLSILRSSFAISILSTVICIQIFFIRMYNVINSFKGNDVAFAVAVLFHWLAATINIIFCAVDFHQSNVGDHISHKDGGWSRLN